MVVPGDIIDFFLENLPSLELQAEELPLEILFENSDALVLNKARGMVVHPGPGNRSATLVNGVLFYVQKFEGFDEGDIRPGIVHRLDKDTTGVLILAKNIQAHSFLANQFKARQTQKMYYALGKVTPRGRQTLQYYSLPREIRNVLGRDPKNRQKFTVLPQSSGRGKEAVSIIRLLGHNDGATLGLFEIKLVTGRTHQIRVHLASLGYPISGDALYGRDSGPLLLHARSLSITLPGEDYPRTFIAPLPSDFPEEFARKIESKESGHG